MRVTAAVLLGLLAAAFGPSPVLADPATAIGFAVLAGQAIATSAPVVAALTPIGAAILAASIGVAGALLTSLFQKQPAAAQLQLRGRTFETHPPFRVHIGEFEQEGNVVFQHVDDSFYYFTLLLSSVPVDGGNLRIWVNDVELDLVGKTDANSVYDMALTGGAYPENNQPYANTDTDQTVNRADAPTTKDGQDYTEDVVVWFGRGEQTQFPQDWIDYLATDLPNISTASWEDCAVLHVRCRYGDPRYVNQLWGGRPIPPNVRVRCKGAKLYDPRKDSTSGVTGASGSHRVDDPDTWEYSFNPAVAWLNMAIHEKVLAKPHETIVIQMVADAADDCDVNPGDTFSTLTPIDYDFSTDTPSIVDRTGSASTDPGHAVLAYSRGDLEISGGELVPTGTDTDGTVDNDETARWGIYFDLIELGLDPSKAYEFDATITRSAGPDLIRRQVITQAEATSGITDANALAYSLPKTAGNVTVAHDTGFQDTASYSEPGPVEVTGRFVGWTHYDGEPSAPFVVESDGNVGTTARILGSGDSRTITFQNALQENDIVVIFRTSRLDISANYTFSPSGYTSEAGGDLPGGWTWKEIHYKRMGATPDTSVTITNNGGAEGSFVYFVVRGGATSGVPWYRSSDVPAASSVASGASGAPDPDAATTQAVNDLHVVLGYTDDFAAGPPAMSGWTFLAYGISSNSGYILSKKPGAIASLDPPAITGIGTSEDWAALHIIFKPGAASGITDLKFTFTEVGSGVKFRCDGLLVVENREWDLLKPIEESFAATRDSTGGVTGIRAGVYNAPTVSLSEPIAANLEYAGRTDPGADKFIGVYLSRLQDYKETETGSYSIRSGDRTQTIELPFIREQYQAERVTKIMAERARRNRNVTGVWTGQEYYRRIGEPVNFNSSPLAMMDDEYRISSKRTAVEAVEGSVRFRNVMALIEEDSAIYDYDHATDFPGSDEIVYRPPPVVSGPGAPQNLTAVSGNAGAVADTTPASDASDYTAGIKITWEAGSGTIERYEIQYSTIENAEALAEDGIEFLALPDVDSDSTFNLGAGVDGYLRRISPVTLGATYTIRVRSIGITGESAWVYTTVVATAPSDPIGAKAFGMGAATAVGTAVTAAAGSASGTGSASGVGDTV